MKAMPEIAFTVVLALGLLAILAWWLAGRGDAEDSGLSVMWEDRTEDDGLDALYQLPAADRDGAP
jgi:hypothetical protein